MIVSTTISSTKVKPRERPNLPFRISRTIARFLHRLAIYVEDALPAPRLALGIVLIAAHAPLGLACKRIHRDAAKEAHLLPVRTRQLYTLHQDVQRLRPVVCAHLL